MSGHLKEAAKLSGQKNNFAYYCYHARIAFIASGELIYIGVMSFIHGVFPFIYSGFELAELLIKTINKIRASVPDWDGWNKLSALELSEIKILKHNVFELQEQLNSAHERIAKLRLEDYLKRKNS